MYILKAWVGTNEQGRREMNTIRQITVANGTETHTLDLVFEMGCHWLWDKTNDKSCDSLCQIADDSDLAVMDVIRENGFEIVEA